MKKLRLDLDSIAVEAFTTTPQHPQRGTLFGNYTLYYESCGQSCGASHCGHSCYQTRCAETCNLDAGCYGTGVDNMCTGDCTGVGVFCYTADPAYFDCTGGGACDTQGGGCTNTTCTVDNVTCANC